MDQSLIEWKNKLDKNPALVVGIRQCEKKVCLVSLLIRNFTRKIKKRKST